jgi:hypothetical protein
VLSRAKIFSRAKLSHHKLTATTNTTTEISTTRRPTSKMQLSEETKVYMLARSLRKVDG